MDFRWDFRWDFQMFFYAENPELVLWIFPEKNAGITDPADTATSEWVVYTYIYLYIYIYYITVKYHSFRSFSINIPIFETLRRFEV